MSDDDAELYSRQCRFAPFGAEAHERWSRLEVAVAGLGGLGSHAAELLVRSGVGKVRLIDRDVVELSNLPRQGLYRREDAVCGRSKAEAAAERLSGLGLGTDCVAFPRDLTATTADALLGGCDLVVDGLDNFESRYLLADWCHRAQLPWVYGGAVAGRGAVALFAPGSRPCLRCLFPESSPSAVEDTCDTAGVLTPLPAMIASLQVSEAMRFVAQSPWVARFMQVEPFAGRWRSFEPRSPTETCASCTDRRYPALDRGEQDSLRLCGRETLQLSPSDSRALDLGEIASRWQGLGAVTRTPFLVRLALPKVTLSLFDDGRALFQGVTDPAIARSLYARYVGH